MQNEANSVILENEEIPQDLVFLDEFADQEIQDLKEPEALRRSALSEHFNNNFNKTFSMTVFSRRLRQYTAALIGLPCVR